MPRTLAARLATVYALTFVALLGLVFVLLYASVRTALEHRLDGDLIEDVEWLRTAHERGGDAAVLEAIRREGESDDVGELFVVLGTAEGAVLSSTNLERWPDARIDPALARLVTSSVEPIHRTERFAGHPSGARTVLARIGDERIAYLAESLEGRDEIMSLLLGAFALVFAVAVPLASLSVWLLSRKASHGIEAINDAATAIGEGELCRRAPLDDDVAEVRALAEAFNTMAGRNQKLIDDMRDMTDSIAHDLRSPLTRVRIIAESSLREGTDLDGHVAAANDIVHECDRLTRMIDFALDVSEAEAGVSRAARVSVDLGMLAARVTELFEPLAEEQGIALELERGVPDELVVRGERTALERLLVNLVDNALKFTPSGGSVRIATHRCGETIELDVVDDGIGIAAADLERVFDRYYRADESRTTSGSGLGLSYARAVARLFDGELEAHSEPGSWTRLRLRLPAIERQGTTAHDREPRAKKRPHVAASVVRR